MKVLSCTFIVLATLALFTCSSSSITIDVLSFGSTVQDYVMFRPDFGAFTSQFSLCSWVRKSKTYGNPWWFHYRTTSSKREIGSVDDGYSEIFGNLYLNKRNQLGITPGTWYHYCLCWSYSSGPADVYHNGVKVGSIATPYGRRLQTGGVLVLGQYQLPIGRIETGYGNRGTFGGQLFRLNMFSKKFTAAEVRTMYQAGMCFEADKIHGSYRQLTWESILRQRRYGNVRLVSYTFIGKSCSLYDKLLAGTWKELEEVEGRLDDKETELQEVKSDLTETQSELETTQYELETTQYELETTQSELVTTKAVLEQRQILTQSELETTQFELVTTKAVLEQRLILTQSQLETTQAGLETTQSELETTQSELETTQAGLETTQSELETTQSELETTQSELETTQSELETTKSVLEQRLNKTQSELETTQSELETLKADLNKMLNSSQSELATKIELELTQALLIEFRNELKSIRTNLGQRLDQIQNETEETKTKFQDTLTELEETKSKLEETKCKLALYTRNSTRSVLQALKFGTTVGDYIMFRPNMEPFTDQFSLCSWIRKFKSDGQPYWISYATEELNSEIGINVQGLSSIFDDNFDWRRHLDITPGTWFQYCMCWSYSSRTADIYFNGVKAGSITTPLEKRLDTGGSLVLGQYQSEDGEILTKHGNRYTFGGELLKLNIFSKKFSDEEVTAMFQAGMCSDIEDTYVSYRRLTWESIIEQPRRGNVELVDSVISCTSAGSGEETVSEMTGEEITTHN